MTDLMKICVASGNPVKVEAVNKAFYAVFPDSELELKSVSVSSGVSDQPMTDEETYLGAKTRVDNAYVVMPNADYWVGLEGGIAPNGNQLEAFAWMHIRSRLQSSHARTASFTLPSRVTELIHQGMELGHANDQVFNESNSKQKMGAVGLLTNGLIDRTDYYTHALILALIPFVQTELYTAG